MDALSRPCGGYRRSLSSEVQLPGDGRTNHGEFCHQGSQHIAPYTVGEHSTFSMTPENRHVFTSVERAPIMKNWKLSW